MGTGVLVAGMICLVVSAIWLIMAYGARVGTRFAVRAWTGAIATVASALGLLAVRAAVGFESEPLDQEEQAVMFLTWFTVVSLAASLVVMVTAWAARGMTFLHRLLTQRLPRD